MANKEEWDNLTKDTTKSKKEELDDFARKSIPILKEAGYLNETEIETYNKPLIIIVVSLFIFLIGVIIFLCVQVSDGKLGCEYSNNQTLVCEATTIPSCPEIPACPAQTCSLSCPGNLNITLQNST